MKKAKMGDCYEVHGKACIVRGERRQAMAKQPEEIRQILVRYLKVNKAARRAYIFGSLGRYLNKTAPVLDFIFRGGKPEHVWGAKSDIDLAFWLGDTVYDPKRTKTISSDQIREADAIDITQRIEKGLPTVDGHDVEFIIVEKKKDYDKWLAEAFAKKEAVIVKGDLLGDCYEVHANAFVNGFLEEAGGLLCHGTVWHPKVGWHGHCWLELNEDVVADYSNGHGVVVRRETYYAIGKVKNVSRYGIEQARALVLKEGTYGPWEAQGIMTKENLHDSSGGV